MRIAFAMINCNRRDGSARAVNEVAERLARRGHEVHLFARKAEDLDLTQIRWHRVPGPGRPEIADFLSYHHSVNHLLRRHDFDIVHSIGPNTARANVVTIQNIQPAKRKILARFAGAARISPARRLTRRLYLAATSAAEKALYERKPGPLFLPVSQGVEKELRREYQIGDSPVRIIPNAADTTLFRPLSAGERQAWRAAQGIADTEWLCVFSGGEWARKGLDLAIRALASLDARLFVAGDDPDRDRFKALAQSCGARVTFGGFRRDMATALAAGDLFLFPSHYEAFSLATLEAAACGLPLVATKINGTEDLIEPGINGAFVQPDPEDIARVVAGLLAAPDPLRAMGRRAREIVLARYTWDRVADLTEEAYKTLVS